MRHARRALPTERSTGLLVHWNLAGWSMHRGDIGIAVALVDAVRALPSLPVAVTVNEVCDRQYATLADTLAPLGYDAAAAWSIPDFDRPGCRAYGNAVLWQAATASPGPDGSVSGVARRATVQRWTYSDAVQADGPATTEKRTLLRVNLPGVPLRIATTHLHRDRAWASRQLTEARSLLTDQPPDEPDLCPTVLAGDLNLPPWDTALRPWYRENAEADRLPRYLARPTTTGLRKLDYVFAPRGRTRFAGPLGLVFRPRLSDHARLSVAISVLDAS